MPVPLYQGALSFAKNGRHAQGFGHIAFEWLPSPRLRYRARFLDSGLPEAADQNVPGKGTVSLLGDFNISKPPPLLDELDPLPIADAYADTRGLLDALEWGRADRLNRVVFNVINALPIRSQRMTSAGKPYRLALEAPPWEILLDTRNDMSTFRRELTEVGGFGFTHVGMLRRLDSRPFQWSEAAGVAQALTSVLQLSSGRLTGPALWEGLDEDGERVWSKWDVPLVDPWRFAWSWCPLSGGDQLSELLRLWVDRIDVPFWNTVLKRAVRYFIEGNDPDPLDLPGREST